MRPQFAYKDGSLHCEDVPLATIGENTGGVTYVYSRAAMTDNYTRFSNALAPLNPRIFYAMKANDTPQIIQHFAQLGAGIDAVRKEEVMLAVACGVDPKNIVFSGLEKDEDALRYALTVPHKGGRGRGVGQINIESEDELRRINKLVLALREKFPDLKQRVAFRVKPGIGAGGHGKITTGNEENKFGISVVDTKRLYAEAATMQGIELGGLSMHIGSQIVQPEPEDENPYREAFKVLAGLVRDLRADGLEVPTLDLGGGLGIDYTGDTKVITPQEYAEIVQETVGDLGCELAFEPGRFLVANAGVLISPTAVIKEQTGQPLRPITKSNMAHLVRTAMYDARHQMASLHRAEGGEMQDMLPAGGICESSDEWFEQSLQVPVKDDSGIYETMWVAHLDAGAYGAAMESYVNMTPRAAVVVVDGRKHEVIRPRQTSEQLVAEKMASYGLAEQRGRGAAL